MNEHQTDTRHLDEAELLLPWYVAGTLSEADRARVDAWLANNPEAQAHLARAIEEHEVVLAAADEMPMPRPSAVNDLLAAIGADRPSVRSDEGWLNRLWNMLSPRYAMAGAAALLLMVVGQAAVIGVLSTSSQPASFETASGSTVAHDEITALVAFQPDVSVQRIAQYLDDNGLRVVDGPKPGGIFVIAAERSEAGTAALDTLGADQTLVRFFSVTQ